MNRQKIAITVAAIGFIAAAIILFRPTGGENTYGDNNANLPDGVLFICGEKTCGHTFPLTMKQLGEHHEKHYGEPVPCAKCAKPALRAEKCEHCQTIHVQERGGGACPKCGK